MMQKQSSIYNYIINLKGVTHIKTLCPSVTHRLPIVNITVEGQVSAG